MNIEIGTNFKCFYLNNILALLQVKHLCEISVRIAVSCNGYSLIVATCIFLAHELASLLRVFTFLFNISFLALLLELV